MPETTAESASAKAPVDIKDPLAAGPAGEIAQLRSQLAQARSEAEIAVARVTEAEGELVIARRAQEQKIERLEQKLAWFEEHELDLRQVAEKHAWFSAALRGWVIARRITQRLGEVLRR